MTRHDGGLRLPHVLLGNHLPRVLEEAPGSPLLGMGPQVCDCQCQYSSSLTVTSSYSHFEDGEQTRPEYEASVKTTRINPVTKKREPFLTTWNKVVRVAVSASSVIFMVNMSATTKITHTCARVRQTKLTLLFNIMVF